MQIQCQPVLFAVCEDYSGYSDFSRFSVADEKFIRHSSF